MTMSNRMVLLTAFLVVLSGCLSSRIDRYPTFLSQKANFKSGKVLMDIVLIHDTLKDTDRIDLDLNKKAAAELLPIFRDSLKAKGFPVEDAVLTSIGAAMGKHNSYKLIHNVFEQQLEYNQLLSGRPPFFVDGSYESDSAHVLALSSVYKSLLLADVDNDAEHTVIQDATSLRGLEGASTLYVVFVGGYEVPPVTIVSEEIGSSRETVGRVRVQRITQASVTFFILNTETGELLWSDRRHVQGGTLNREKFLRMTLSILDGLP